MNVDDSNRGHSCSQKRRVETNDATTATMTTSISNGRLSSRMSGYQLMPTYAQNDFDDERHMSNVNPDPYHGEPHKLGRAPTTLSESLKT
jgi:hypothetical protein